MRAVTFVSLLVLSGSFGGFAQNTTSQAAPAATAKKDFVRPMQFDRTFQFDAQHQQIAKEKRTIQKQPNALVDGTSKIKITPSHERRFWFSNSGH